VIVDPSPRCQFIVRANARIELLLSPFDDA
jgi:hypothetical protein